MRRLDYAGVGTGDSLGSETADAQRSGMRKELASSQAVRRRGCPTLNAHVLRCESELKALAPCLSRYVCPQWQGLVIFLVQGVMRWNE